MHRRLENGVNFTFTTFRSNNNSHWKHFCWWWDCGGGTRKSSSHWLFPFFHQPFGTQLSEQGNQPSGQESRCQSICKLVLLSENDNAISQLAFTDTGKTHWLEDGNGTITLQWPVPRDVPAGIWWQYDMRAGKGLGGFTRF